MTVTASKRASNALSSRLMTALAVCLFVALATAGLLGLSSCASTPTKGGQGDPALYLILSNSVATGKIIAPFVPAPANSILEGVLAAGGALLALWATHLHRSINHLQNGGAPTNGGATQGNQAPP